MLNRRTFLQGMAGAALAGPALGVLDGLAGTHAAGAKQPNILIIFNDDQSFHAVGTYGNPDVMTPHLDRLAKEGMTFTHAFCNGPFCAPSRNTLMTGLYPHEHGRMTNQLNRKPVKPPITYLPRELKKAGYRTAGFGKWHSSFSAKEAGFESFKDFSKHKKDAITDAVLDFLTSRKGKPWFAYCAYHETHSPWNPPAHFIKQYTSKTLTLRKNVHASLDGKPACQQRWLKKSRQQQEKFHLTDPLRALARYYGSSSHVDDKIGRILDALDKLGMADDTLVIFTADQGNTVGNHGLYFKGPGLYEEFIHVPLIMRMPGMIRADTRSTILCSTVDLAPTVLSMAGLPAQDSFSGADLLPALTGGNRAQDAPVIAQLGPLNRGGQKGMDSGEIRMLRTRDWKLGLYEDDLDELYDLKNDPYELVNLAGQSGYRDTYHALKTQLIRWMRTNRDYAAPIFSG